MKAAEFSGAEKTRVDQKVEELSLADLRAARAEMQASALRSNLEQQSAECRKFINECAQAREEADARGERGCA